MSPLFHKQFSNKIVGFFSFVLKKKEQKAAGLNLKRLVVAPKPTDAAVDPLTAVGRYQQAAATRRPDR